jgi:hypothetical protein
MGKNVNPTSSTRSYAAQSGWKEGVLSCNEIGHVARWIGESEGYDIRASGVYSDGRCG